MSLLDQLGHVSEEEGQKQNTDMRAVDVRVRHDNDLAVSELGNVKFVTDTAAQRLNNGNERGVCIHLVKSGLFYVENLTAQGKNGLKARVTSSVICEICWILFVWKNGK